MRYLVFSLLSAWIFAIQIPNADAKPIALIIRASDAHQDSVFQLPKGFQKRDRYRLVQAGYEIRELKIGSLIELNQGVAGIPNDSIGFLWIAAHGSPRSIRFSNQYKPSPDDIQSTWKWLPEKLTERATIFLDSCSTGKPEGDFYNNIQFGFAKLTIHLPQVRIIAPSEDMHLSSFKIGSHGEFDFNLIASPYERNKNIALMVGGKTKAILNEQSQDPWHFIMTSKERNRLYESIEQPDGNVYLDSRDVLLDTQHHIDRSMLLSILKNPDFAKALSEVKYLVEDLHASVNVESESLIKPWSREQASPLFAAIHIGNELVVQYLLENGADTQLVFEDLTPLTLSEQLYQATISEFEEGKKVLENVSEEKRALLIERKKMDLRGLSFNEEEKAILASLRSLRVMNIKLESRKNIVDLVTRYQFRQAN